MLITTSSKPASGLSRIVKFANAKGVANDAETEPLKIPEHPAAIAQPAAAIPAMHPKYFDVASDFPVKMAMSAPTTEITDEIKSISISNTFLLCCQRCAFAQMRAKVLRIHYSVERDFE